LAAGGFRIESGEKFGDEDRLTFEQRRAPAGAEPGPPARESLGLRAAGASDRGRMRAVDEDAYAADPQIGVFLVADGVGGSRGGEVASRLAVDAAREVLRGALSEGSSGVGEKAPALLARAFRAAHESVKAAADSEPEHRGMATTLVALLVRGRSGWVAHLGDSRGYLVRRGDLRQLTEDHSVIAGLARNSPGLEVSSFKKSPIAHVLTRCVGKNGDPAPDVREIAVEPGDRLLLCCDGLTDMVADTEIQAILASRQTPEECCRRLISLANEAGGRDNITAVVVDVG
jgi:serine/threonine protein phosphatase PrpC